MTDEQLQELYGAALAAGRERDYERAVQLLGCMGVQPLSTLHQEAGR